jgi:hypothetical protein
MGEAGYRRLINDERQLSPKAAVQYSKFGICRPAAFGH